MAKADEKKSDDAPKPVEKAAPKPPARVCDPNDRAGDGLRRFKVRADNYGDAGGGRPKAYILAPDRASAEALYLAREKLDQLPDKAEPVRLVVTELPD